jgi:plasmid stabilization system protein ParE
MFPHAGAPRENVRPGLRVATKHKYAAYYLTTETEIIVIRVLHGAQDLDL